MVRRPLVGNSNIHTVVGNFKDGMPDGLTKMEMDDGAIFIGNFKDGVVHGFYRIWNATGDLIEVGHKFHNM